MKVYPPFLYIPVGWRWTIKKWNPTSYEAWEKTEMAWRKFLMNGAFDARGLPIYQMTSKGLTNGKQASFFSRIGFMYLWMAENPSENLGLRVVLHHNPGAYLAQVLMVLNSTRNFGTIYYCLYPLAPVNWTICYYCQHPQFKSPR